MDRAEIDTTLARRLIDSQFPRWADLPIRPVELSGWDNRTFRLGDELSIRLPTGAWYAKQVEKEQRWLPELAPQLPLPIPAPVAEGRPEGDYPHPWSVYRWLDGAPAATTPPSDTIGFATALAGFLNALAEADADGGPEPGEHNFYRGAPLDHYAPETHDALAVLDGEIPRDEAEGAWEDAMRARFAGEPVWFHGDVAVGNLLMRDGRLAAVLDFGSSGVGDPACDTVIAWTFLEGAARDAFKATYAVDAGTWVRGIGWALWKALITLVGALEADDRDAVLARKREIAAILGDRPGRDGT